MEIVETKTDQLDTGTWKVWFKAAGFGYVYTDSLYYDELPSDDEIRIEIQNRVDNWYAFVSNPPAPPPDSSPEDVVSDPPPDNVTDV